LPVVKVFLEKITHKEYKGTKITKGDQGFCSLSYREISEISLRTKPPLSSSL